MTMATVIVLHVLLSPFAPFNTTSDLDRLTDLLFITLAYIYNIHIVQAFIRMIWCAANAKVSSVNFLLNIVVNGFLPISVHNKRWFRLNAPSTSTNCLLRYSLEVSEVFEWLSKRKNASRAFSETRVLEKDVCMKEIHIVYISVMFSINQNYRKWSEFQVYVRQSGLTQPKCYLRCKSNDIGSVQSIKVYYYILTQLKS